MPRHWCVSLLVIIFNVLIINQLHAQNYSNVRFGTCTVDSLVVSLDSLSILPGSLLVTGLDSADYTVDCASATLRLRTPELLGRSISYTYRVLPMNFAQPHAHKSTDIILPRFVPDPTSHNLSIITPPTETSLFDSDLQGNGSISRSVSVGNNQNFVLDANLNLQLSGMLAPGLEILANITDENVPVQPEGNTRYLRDFNKVFIQLKYKDLLQIHAGDVELASPQNSYFFQINRQFIGIKANVNSLSDSVNHLSNMVGGGITKGKYARNVIPALNGVQGPYKLSGEQNETNLIILSGSEQVYLDGVLLTRGQDNDYIIDYNLGEITFTARHLITEHSRIIVTFEYSDQYYSRFNLFTYNEFTHEKNSKLTLNVNFFHEQDLKGQSIQPELNNDQMLFLSEIGDRLSAANYNSETLVNDFTINEILYHKVDTLVNGTLYNNIYVFAGKSHDSVYRVAFSYVGAHQGNYILSQSAANGKLYQWVAPENGVPQGDYEPITLLNTPKMRDMLTVGASYTLSDKLKIRTEVAFSYEDKNLFAKADDHDNAGLAYKLNLDYKTKVVNRKHNDSLWRYSVGVDYELIHKDFTPFSSFRNVEFFRDYNLTDDYSTTASEQIVKVSTGFSHPICGSTIFAANWLYRFGEVSGLRSQIVSSHHFRGWRWNAATSYLMTKDNVQKTNFVKSDNDFSKNFSKVAVGVRENLEYNIFRLAENARMRAGSYAFNEAAVYVKNSDSTNYSYSLQYMNRLDYGLNEDALRLNSVAHEAKVSFEFLQWKHNRLKGSAVYRNDNVRDTSSQFVSEHNFVGSIDYYGSFWKGAVTLSIYYEAGSGLEQKKNYAFLKVAAGQGTHVWNDYNGNGIEELDEFELAAFQSEADYVKVWLTTNEYVNTRNCGTTQSLQLRPANVWRNQKGFRGFLAMFGNTTTLRTYQKNTLQQELRAFNPFLFSLDDSVLVSQTANVKNSLNFALPNPYFSADYTYSHNQAKNLLYYGVESTQSDCHQLSFRSSPVKMLIIKTIYSRIKNSNSSDCFEGHNFQILSHKLKNCVILNLENNLSLSADFTMTYKRNLWAADKANLYQAILSADYRMKERGTLSVNLQYIKVLYNQNTNNSIFYEMLEGLTVGNNFLWDVGYQTKLFEYLQLSLQYEGRLTNENRLIHTGYLQLKAMF